LVVAPLASLPYWLALVLFQGATFALYLAVIATILRPARRQGDAVARSWLPAAAAYPAVFINIGHGQNGFLTAGLLGAALMVLRPLFAGVLMGLIVYKPQFAAVIPLALLAGSQWRTLAVTAVTAIVLAALSCIIFGVDCWAAFVASTELSRKLLLEQGGVGFEKLQSAFAAVSLLGGNMSMSYVVQGAVSALAVCGTVWVWRCSENHNIKSAVLLASTALASPYLLDYDLVLLGPAIASFLEGMADGPRPYDVSFLVFVWIAPLFARTAAHLSGIPVGFLATLTLFALIMRRTNGMANRRLHWHRGPNGVEAG